MEFRKTLLLSAAIPLMSLPLTLPTHADAAGRQVASGEILVAQADTSGDQTDEKRKKHHGDKQNGDEHAKKPAEQQGQAAPKEQPKPEEKAAQPAPKAAPSNDNASQAEKKPSDSGGGDQAAQPKPKHDNAKQEMKQQAAPKEASQPDQGKAKSNAAAEGDHSRKHRSDKKAQEKSSGDQNAEAPKKPAAQQDAVKKDTATQDNAAKPADQAKPKAEASGKAPQPTKQENAGDRKMAPKTGGDNAATSKSTNEAVAPKKSEPAQSNDNASKDQTGGSTQNAEKQAIPAQPEKNAAAPASNGGKPARFKGANGAPVLDSAKDSAPAGKQQMNGTAETQGQTQTQTQSKTLSTAPAGSGSTTVTETSQPVKIQSAEKVKGQEVKEPPKFRLPQDAKVEKRTNNRVILNIDNRTVIENNDYGRLAENARDVRYETLSGGRTRQVVVRQNGVRIVTIRNEYGDIVHRSRIDRDGHEIALIYTPDGDRRDRRFYRDPAVDLPPLRLNEPVDEYVLEGRHADERQYVTFLEKPPIERIPHVYTLDQVRYSARLRDMMPRIDLDTITFASGSADIGSRQAQSLQMLADAIRSVLRKDPGQVFLVEGHTDAVGSAQSNLVLSDERAESVASVLTREFDVPPENLVTQGYGEQYLKVDTEGAERANRRVTVRRITPLVRPVAQR